MQYKCFSLIKKLHSKLFATALRMLITKPTLLIAVGKNGQANLASVSVKLSPAARLQNHA